MQRIQSVKRRRRPERIKELELEDPLLARLPGDAVGGALKATLTDAKAAVAVYGSSSPEANEAWEKLDLCFGSSDSNSSSSSSSEDGVLELTEECDIDNIIESASYRYSAAALKAHHMYNAVIETGVLDGSLEALSMIEGLEKFARLEKRRLDDAHDAEDDKYFGP